MLLVQRVLEELAIAIELESQQNLLHGRYYPRNNDNCDSSKEEESV